MRKTTVRIIATLLVMVLVSLPLTGCAPDRNLIEEHTWHLKMIKQVVENLEYGESSPVIACSSYAEDYCREHYPDDDFKIMEMTLTASNGTFTITGDANYTGTYKYGNSSPREDYLGMAYAGTLSDTECFIWVTSDPEIPSDDDYMRIEIGEYKLTFVTEAKLKEQSETN